MSLLAETSALLSDTDSAPIIYGLLLPWATFNAADYLEGIRGSVSRYLGLLATTITRWHEAMLAGEVVGEDGPPELAVHPSRFRDRLLEVGGE